MPQDYVASFSTKKGSELLHFGVRGMRWGVINSTSASGGTSSGTASTTTKKSGGTASTTTKKSGSTGSSKASVFKKELLKPLPKPAVFPAHGNSKYAQLKAKAKKDVHSLTDDELKYLNGRTEALGKAKKLIEKPDSWLTKSIKTTIQSVFQENMKSVMGTAIKAFLTDRANAKINTTATKQNEKRNWTQATTINSKGELAQKPAEFKVTTL